jgi:uncharacterized membrane protein YtjA (UPF0391 family)
MLLRLGIAFLVIALIAAVFGFAFVAGYSFAAARIVFFVAIALAAAFFLRAAGER